MKKIASLLLCAACLWYSPSCDAADLRVLILPFENNVDDAKSVVEELTAAAISEVRSSGKLVYVPAEKFAADWRDAAQKTGAKVEGVGPDEVARDIGALRPLLDHEKVGAIAGYRKLWNVDFVITGEVTRGAGMPKLSVEIVSTDTGRFYAVASECERGAFKATVAKEVRWLIDKAQAVRRVAADDFTDPAQSVVRYDIPTAEGEDIVMTADYTSKRPDPAFENIDIAPAAGLKDGVKSLRIKSREGKHVTFTFSYKDGQIADISMGMEPLPPSSDAEHSEKLAVVSKKGHDILFSFFWQGKDLTEVRVEPKVNPFSEVK